MSSPDPRFEALAQELRAAKPAAPAELRQKVASLEPAPRRQWVWPRFSARRTALVLVPACVVAAVGAALIHGVVNSGSKTQRKAVPLSIPAKQANVGANRRALLPPAHGFAQAFAPSKRLQRYDVRLRLRVRDLESLSSATKRAMAATRRYGGYVASVTYAAPTAKRGGAHLVLMVPIDRVQDALQRLSGLGTILAQHVSIQDLQRQVDEESSAITRLARRIERTKAALAGSSLTPAQRLELERGLASDQRRLRALRGTKTTTVRRAAFARIELALVTRKAVAGHSSRLGRTFRDAASVLGREGEVLLYALIVAGPLLLLGAAGLAASRTARRRADQRLLS